MEKQAIMKEIKQYGTIIIHRHVRPDPDALGSQAGLKEIIQASFPEKKVYIVGEDDPEFDYLVKMDVVSDATYEGALIIICDTANTPRVDDERYMKGEKIIKIDHHPNVDIYGDVQWVDTTASSTSEMIYELYEAGKEEGFILNDAGARLLYAGIVGDTGRFLFPSTTKKTFQYAAELVTYNFNRSELYQNLYSVETHILRLRGHILKEFEMFDSGLCAVKLTKELLETFQVSPDETGQLVQIFGDVKGIKAWVIFVEEEDLIRVRLRSKGPIINEIAAKYDGGGHPMASGATIYKWKEADQVIHDLNEACENY
ncbi:DHH family phosphoesterase [Oceanobacillus alkalisoli]|uniref:DHH family phosphoesterase n=1 Tax=Oceanobacillus alkalisoli TaxID=2925113 RepID=UPI001EEFE051|nr:bifunctional oligoribonuclease/PAP phosphatase NrnA [Oceanobacillus alkalisoli]MCF3943347.1 bifunctional oligoribonuclease/PAP phosphatase NrnA [Oceanobacillus alkalisoli]MCG5105288.1 bifunctional oligoribonuclease/PAP phosphatase NrnA [Oceanobacillus alkalisoli]